MELPVPPARVAVAGLRALKTIAAADGELRELELRLIAAVQQHVVRTDVPLASLPAIEPEELAAEVEAAEFRRRIVAGCCLMTLIDGDAADSERALLARYARALAVDDKTLRTIRHFAEGHMLRLRLDVARRFVAFQRAKKTLRDEGVLALLRVLRDQLRKGENAELAERYRALGALPPNTLGRQYHDFMRANDFALPGEVGSAPELIVFHDAHHVLAGYGTSPDEESQIAAFHAGTDGQDPFGMLLFAVMQFHLGVLITPSAEGFHGMVDPALLLAAFVRGSKVNGDLIRTWDARDHFERDVDELRRELSFVRARAPRATARRKRPHRSAREPAAILGSCGGAR